MSRETGHSDHIPGTKVFTGQRSQLGFRLNRFAYSLRLAKNRKTYVQDPEAYMQRYGLSDWEKKNIYDKNWKALVDEGGGSIYMLLKIGAVADAGLAAIGAQQRGETQEEFMKTRNVALRENT
jgi:protocatechuate 4,5-dioxygenase alpha chain